MKENSILQSRPAEHISLSEFMAAAIFECLVTIFAVWTVLTQTARLLGISFAGLSVIFSIVIIPVSLVLLRSLHVRYRHSDVVISQADNHALVLLAILMIIGAALSLGAIRPDLDDVDYASQAVYFLKYPSLPLDLLRHDHGLVQAPFFWPLYIFYALELFCAYVASVFHVPFLHVYHFILPVLGGLLIPLAWFYLFSRFSRRTAIALLAAAGVCVFLSLNGSPHRAFGNFAFVRIWHGKAILMSIVPPLFVAFVMDFFNAPTFAHWRRVFALISMTTGLSAMSVFFMPFLGIVGICYWLVFTKRSIRNVLMFFSSYIYLILIAGYFGAVFNKPAMKFLGQTGWPATFAGQAKMVFVDMGSVATVLFIVFTMLSLFVAKKPERRFLGLWLLGTIILFLNPVVFPLIANHLTTLNNYWRLFYLLPFPFVIGFPITYLENKLPDRPGWGYGIFAGLILIGIFGNSYPHAYATFGNVRFSFGHYKIDPDVESDVRRIIAASNDGVMLAPFHYSAVVPIFSPDLPQVAVRPHTLGSLAAAKGMASGAEMKYRAIQYVSGESSEGLPETVSLVKAGIMDIVVIPKAVTYGNWPVMEECLNENNFRLVERTTRFLLYRKEGQEEVLQRPD